MQDTKGRLAERLKANNRNTACIKNGSGVRIPHLPQTPSGVIKAQKNPAIKDWIVGHNIVRIALYCKRINSHFSIFLHHTERKRSASYLNEMEMLHGGGLH